MLFIAKPGLLTSLQFHLKEVLNPSQSSHRISAFAVLFKSSTLLIFHCQAPPIMFPRAKVTQVALWVNFEGFILKYRLRLVQNSSASSFFLVNFLMSNLTPLQYFTLPHASRPDPGSVQAQSRSHLKTVIYQDWAWIPHGVQVTLNKQAENIKLQPGLQGFHMDSRSN